MADEPDLEAGLGSVNNKSLKTAAVLAATGNTGAAGKLLKAGNSSFVSTAVKAVAGAAVMTSAASLLLTEPLIVDIASIATSTFAPYVVYQRNKIGKMDTMTNLQNDLRHKVNALKSENNKLTNTVSELEESTDRLKDVTSSFDTIVQESKHNAESLLYLVKESKTVQSDMEEILKQRLIRDVLSLLLQADREGDFTLDENEMEVLIIRMHMVPGIDFKEERFRRKLKLTKDHSINTIFQIFQNLIDGNPDDDDALFSMHTHLIKD